VLETSSAFDNLVLDGQETYHSFGILTPFGSSVQRFAHASLMIEHLEGGSDESDRRVDELYETILSDDNLPDHEEGFESKLMQWREEFLEHQRGAKPPKLDMIMRPASTSLRSIKIVRVHKPNGTIFSFTTEEANRQASQKS
jgi:hypothetical protein